MWRLLALYLPERFAFVRCRVRDPTEINWAFYHSTRIGGEVFGSGEIFTTSGGGGSLGAGRLPPGVTIPRLAGSPTPPPWGSGEGRGEGGYPEVVGLSLLPQIIILQPRRGGPLRPGRNRKKRYIGDALHWPAAENVMLCLVMCVWCGWPGRAPAWTGVDGPGPGPGRSGTGLDGPA